MIKEWLTSLKVAKDIVKGGISAFKAGEVVDELIKNSIEEYGSMIDDSHKDLYEQIKRTPNNEEKTKLRIEYLSYLAENTALPEDFRNEVENTAKKYKDAENFAMESMEDSMMELVETDEQREAVKKTVDDFKYK